MSFIDLTGGGGSSSGGVGGGVSQPYTLAALGDSITYQYTYATPLIRRCNGYQTWVAALAQGRLVCPTEMNFGVAGELVSEIRARVGDVVDAAPDACVVLGGINDLLDTAVDDVTADLEAIYDTLITSGILVVAVPPIPCAFFSGAPLTADNHRWLAAVRSWVRQHALKTPGMILADPFDMIVDHSTEGEPIGGNNDGTNKTAMTYDGIHPSIRGAYWIGRAIFESLEGILNVKTPLTSGAADIYTAANPYGNKLGGDLAAGNTGGVLESGATGEAPANWKLKRFNGNGTVVGAFEDVALENGFTRKRYKFTMTTDDLSGTERCHLYRTLTAADNNYQIGETVTAYAHVTISGVGPDCLREVHLQVKDGAGEFSRSMGDQVTSGNHLFYPNNDWEAVLETEPLTIADGSSLVLQVIAEIEGVVDSAVTVTVHEVKLARSR